jgi:hypothetical protein
LGAPSPCGTGIKESRQGAQKDLAMTTGAYFSFAIFALYLGLGIFLAWKSGKKQGLLAQVHVSFGSIYIIIGFAYLFTGLQQVSHQLGHPLASEACAMIAQCVAFSVTIPAAFFSSFLLFGNLRLSRYLMTAYTAVTCLAIGLTGTATLRITEYSWGSAWDFDSVILKTFYIMAGAIPALVALVGFIVLIAHPLDSRAGRSRVILISASFTCILVAWIVMPSANEALVVSSRVLALLGAVCAYLAYYPPGEDDV